MPSPGHVSTPPVPRFRSWGPMYADATADFWRTLNDPRRWIIKPGVPVFKPHQRVDPATGRLISVDIPKLYRIAANAQRMERLAAVPTRMTLGHTEPRLPETMQPPVGGYYRNYRVGRFGPSGEPAILADEWLDPMYLPYRRNFPHRSAEYYDDAEEIRGVALLTRDPYLDLGVVAYSQSAPGAVHYSRQGERPLCYHFLMGDAMFPQTFYPPAGAPYNTLTHVLPPEMQGQPMQYAAPAQAPNGLPMMGTYGVPGYHQPPAPGHLFHHAPTHYAPPGLPGIGHTYPAPTPGFTPHTPAHYGPWPAGGMGQQPMPGMPQTQFNGAGMPQAGAPGAAQNYCPTCYQILSDHMRTAAPIAQQPQQTPFPAGDMNGGNGGAPTMDSRTGYGHMGYGRVMPGGMTTLSGLPVGAQMRMDNLQYQLQNSNQAIQLLMYERDQADTAACIADIRRLHAMGFPVGEYEAHELKSKRNPQERDMYLNHIASRYNRVPTDQLPSVPMMGDPTPGYDASANRPATQAEVDLALKINQANPQLPYAQALAYARSQPVAPGMAPAPGGFGPTMPGGGYPAGVPSAFGMVPGLGGMGAAPPMGPQNPMQQYAFPPGGVAPGVPNGMPNPVHPMGNYGAPTLPNGQPFMEPYPGSEPFPGGGL